MPSAIRAHETRSPQGGAAVLLFFELRAPKGTTVRCVLYQTDAGLELRLQASNLPPDRAQPVKSYGRAQELANSWRRELVSQHYYRDP